MSGTRTRALDIGARCRETIVDVIDTGRRQTRWMPAQSSDGRKQMSYRQAFVHVVGEDEPRWIAVERLEPDASSEPEAHGTWLAEVDVARPRVERPVPDADDNRRASRKRARRRAEARRAESRPRSEERSDPASVRPPTAGRDRRAPRVAEKA